MIPGDILTALFIVLGLALTWLALRQALAIWRGCWIKLRARQQRLAEPETHGDAGGWPVTGWPGDG